MSKVCLGQQSADPSIGCNWGMDFDPKRLCTPGSSEYLQSIKQAGNEDLE